MNDDSSNRFKQGRLYEKKKREQLIFLGFKVAKIGIENIGKPLHSFLLLQKRTTPKFFRYQPDVIATNKEISFYLDAKCGSEIERDAYLTYMNFHKIGCDLFLFINPVGEYGEYCIPIQDVILRWGVLNSNYADAVDNGGWFCPRLWNDKESSIYNPDKYKKYKKESKGSGTDNKLFDFKEMKKFEFISSIELLQILQSYFIEKEKNENILCVLSSD